MTENDQFVVSAPGRVCLFGEHSDYLGLDVIAAAIDRYVTIVCKPRRDPLISVGYPDLAESDEFAIDQEVEYRHRRDYLRSAFNVLARRGMRPLGGAELIVTGDLPIASGLSSSSALTVAAVHTVAALAHETLGPRDAALLAYEAEVREFGESGGTMDHMASAYGGIVHVEMVPDGVTSRLPAKIDGIVIGDSLERKEDTVGDLRRIRAIVESEYRVLAGMIKDFDQRTTPLSIVYGTCHSRPSAERRMAEATLRNRDLTADALTLLSSEFPDPHRLGEMLDEHHRILRDDLERSTPKIERLIRAAKDAGALGCKINGSGGGGTMMAYAPGREEDVATAIERAGGKAHCVGLGKGASVQFKL
ncbi:MAG: GHMP kinase [Candidatus Thorarchaeota archaeon]|nr:GHMP kinase [Candidatus Thorarchaeota archaeon]